MKKQQPSASHLRDGARAELLALRFLKRQGCKILATNFTCRVGELDIIALDKSAEHSIQEPCISVVEVRYRRSGIYGGAAATVNHAKQQRIINSSQLWLSQNSGYRNHPVRFDVITLSGDLDKPQLNWLKRAFSCDGVI